MSIAARATAVCPLCQIPILRVRRELGDRLLSLVVPVRRYRCASMVCGWEGLVASRRSRKASTAEVYHRQRLAVPCAACIQGHQASCSK
jgi:hypothetical protein